MRRVGGERRDETHAVTRGSRQQPPSTQKMFRRTINATIVHCKLADDCIQPALQTFVPPPQGSTSTAQRLSVLRMKSLFMISTKKGLYNRGTAAVGVAGASGHPLPLHPGCLHAWPSVLDELAITQITCSGGCNRADASSMARATSRTVRPWQKQRRPGAQRCTGPTEWHWHNGSPTAVKCWLRRRGAHYVCVQQW